MGRGKTRVMLRFGLALFLVATVTLMIEVLLIRVFDVVLVPNVGYMVVSFAMFGMGIAGAFAAAWPLSQETEIRRRHTDNFRHTFARLLRLAEGCDVDGIITDSLRQSAFGLLDQRMESYQPASTESVLTAE